MIAEKIKLLESIKKHQYSKLIAKINKKILDTLKSPHFNQRIRPYLETIQPEGVPYIHYDRDPDNISQIKKLINALYHARLTFEDLENIDIQEISQSFGNLALIYQHTIEHAYQASYLLTHPDIDIQEMFSEELQILLPIVNQAYNFVSQAYQKSNSPDEKKNKKQTISPGYLAGEIAGIAIEQMQPEHGEFDYKFLTQFSAVLPNYIQKFTQAIEKYSSDLVKKEPTLNNEQIKELQKSALTLLNDLENLRGNSLFVSFKVLNYIHIVMNIISLSMSSLEQMGHFSVSSQDVIRDNLAQIKYVLLPHLFGLIDKIETQAMVKPGTLSLPLMVQIKPLYEWLIHYASKPVDFKEKGEELLKIEDSRFLSLRLEKSFERIDKASKALYKINKAQEALNQFYNILENPEHANKSLHELSHETKEKLIEHYKLIKPYMMHVNADLNIQIISSLTGPETWGSYLWKPWRYLNSQVSPDHLSIILPLKEQVATLITKKKATEDFHIALNKDLIEEVNQHTDLVLFPYSEAQEPIFNSDESKVINPGYTCNLFKISNQYRLIKAPQQSIPFQYAPQTLYLKTNEEGLSYEVINPEGDPKTGFIYWDDLPHVPRNLTALLKNQDQFLPEILKHSAAAGHTFSGRELQYNDIKSLLNKRNAVILLNNRTLYYGDILQQQLIKLTPSETNTIQFQQLKKKCNDSCHLASGEEIHLITTVSGYRHLDFQKIEETNHLVNPEYLSADQALDLAQYYKNKMIRMEIAKKAYDEFLALIRNKLASFGIIEHHLLHINLLDKTTKEQCRNLYNQFQAYFINGVTKEYKKSALFFDKYLVYSFTDTSEVVHTPKTDLFEELDDYFQDHFTHIALKWRTKKRDYSRYAEEKFVEEHNAAELTDDSKTNLRKDYLIPHTHYSEYMHCIRMELDKIISELNESMQKELTHKPYGIPYPELEDENQLLSQPKQVLALKQVFNSLYHTEKILTKLEQLNNKSYHTTYVYYLLQTYGHLDEILKLVQSLSKDPHFSFITKELINKTLKLQAVMLEHSEAYQINHNDVAYDKPIQLNSLWYVMNAFHVIPKHLRSITNQNYLSMEELNELQISAKKATYQIESIVQNSGSYFTLFLQIPKMLSLYNNMTARLNEFISTTHGAVANNLNQFYPELFTPMLIEADQWEDQLGLKPGTVSRPLARLFNEFYKGLLHPMDLKSKDHLKLICDPTPLNQRIIHTESTIQEMLNRIDKLEKSYQHLTALYQALQYYEKISGGHVPASPMVRAQTKAVLLESYKNALPKLYKLDKKLQLDLSHKPADSNFDKEINASLQDYEPKLSHIKNKITASYHHYLSLRNSLQMDLDTKQEKLTYLKKQTDIQTRQHVHYVKKYATESFNKQVENFINRHIGLQYTDKEYRHKLKDYLLEFKNEIIEDARTAADPDLTKEIYLGDNLNLDVDINTIKTINLTDDINLKVKNQLIEKIKLFEQQHYASYFHLDTVKVALAQFKNYLSLSTLNIEHSYSIFEDEETLEEKTNKINHLLELAEDELLTIPQRLELINHEVQNPNFCRIMLKYKNVNYFSFTYLIHCILSLFEALHLYTPPHKKLVTDLKQSITTEPKISELTTRFGLFNKEPKQPEDREPLEDPPLLFSLS